MTAKTIAPKASVTMGAVVTLFHSLPSKTPPAPTPACITITISIGAVQEKRQSSGVQLAIF